MSAFGSRGAIGAIALQFRAGRRLNVSPLAIRGVEKSKSRSILEAFRQIDIRCLR